MIDRKIYVDTMVAETCPLGNRYLRIGDEVDPTTLKVVSNQKQTGIFQGLNVVTLDLRVSGGTIESPTPINDRFVPTSEIRLQSWDGEKFDRRVFIHTRNSTNFDPTKTHPATDLVISTAYNDYFNHYTFRDDGVLQCAGLQPMTYINGGSYLGEQFVPHNGLPEPAPDCGNPMYGTIIYDAGSNKLKCYTPGNQYTDIQMGDPVARSYTTSTRPQRTQFTGTIKDRVLTVNQVLTGQMRFGLPFEDNVVLAQQSGEVGGPGTYLVMNSQSYPEPMIFTCPDIAVGTIIYNSEIDEFEGWNGFTWKILG